MDKIQKFPKTIGTAVNVKDPTQGDETDVTALDVALENIADGMLTDVQKSYLNGILGDDKQKKLQALFSIGDSYGQTSYWSDTTLDADKTTTRTITIKFDGQVVEPTTSGNLSQYTKKSTGVYTRAITTASSAPATGTITYKVPAGTYANGTIVVSATDNITVSGSLGAVGISTSNAAYYGFSASKDVDNVNSVIKNLTRITSAISNKDNMKGKFTNNSGADAYIWIITKGESDMLSMGLPALNNAVTGKTITSPVNEEISMNGYKIYIQKNAMSNGDTLYGYISL